MNNAGFLMFICLLMKYSMKSDLYIISITNGRDEIMEDFGYRSMVSCDDILNRIARVSF